MFKRKGIILAAAMLALSAITPTSAESVVCTGTPLSRVINQGHRISAASVQVDMPAPPPMPQFCGMPAGLVPGTPEWLKMRLREAGIIQ